MTRTTTFVLTLALLAASAFAQDVESAKSLVADIEAAIKAKDAGTVASLAMKVPAEFNGIEDKAMRGKLAAVLGKALKSKKLAEAHTDVLTALVEIDDPKLAWKIASKRMPNAKKVEEATDFQIATVMAAGKLAQKSAIKSLLELVTKSKDDKLSAAAAVALGGYKDDEKNRVSIYVELVDAGLKTRPGRSTSKQVSPEAQARWQTVGRGILIALNELTGRKEQDFETHEELYKSNKKKPKSIFED